MIINWIKIKGLVLNLDEIIAFDINKENKSISVYFKNDLKKVITEVTTKDIKKVTKLCMEM